MRQCGDEKCLLYSFDQYAFLDIATNVHAAAWIIQGGWNRDPIKAQKLGHNIEPMAAIAVSNVIGLCFVGLLEDTFFSFASRSSSHVCDALAFVLDETRCVRMAVLDKKSCCLLLVNHVRKQTSLHCCPINRY